MKKKSISGVDFLAFLSLKRYKHISFLSTLVFCILFGVANALTSQPFLGLIVGLTISLMLLAFWQPWFALIYMGVSISLPSVDLSLSGYHLHLIEMTTLFSFIICILRRPSMNLRYPHVAALFFLLIALLSFIHVPEFSSSTNPYSASKRFLELIEMIVALFTATLLIPYVKNISLLLLSLLLSSLPADLVGLDQALNTHYLSLLAGSGVTLAQTQSRLWGPFSSPVNFAMYLITMFSVALGCWLLGTHRWQRIVGAGFTLFISYLLLATGTRSVACSALLILLFAFFLTHAWKKLLLACVVGAAIAISSFHVLQPLFIHDDSSTTNRWLLWREALLLIQSSPWIGVGLQQFHYYYGQLVVGKTNQLDVLGIHPHEQYLEWALESGIPWLIVGLMLLISILLFCWKKYFVASPSYRCLLLITMLIIIANSFISLLDVPFDQLESSTLIFLVVGITLGYVEQIRVTDPRPLIFLTSKSWSAPTTLEHTGDVSSQKIALFLSSMCKYFTLEFYNRFTSKLVSSHEHKTGRAILIQCIGWGIALPLVFPMTALLTRYLGPGAYGEYSLTFPFLTVFALISGTGMDTLIIRQLSIQPRSHWSAILSYAVGVRLISTLLSTCLAIGIALVLPIGQEQKMLLLIGSSSLLFSFSFNGLRIIYTHGYRAEQRSIFLATIETANRLLTAILIAVVVIFHFALLWAYILLVYSDFPAFLLLVWQASKRYTINPSWHWKSFRFYILGALPLSGHYALTLISEQIDLVLLLTLCGPLQAGLYALASRITDPLISIAYAYGNSYHPVLCTAFAEGQQRFALICRAAFRQLALWTIPVAILITIQSQNIILLLGGTQFIAATIAVRLLIWSLALNFFNILAEKACTAANREKQIPLMTVTSASINIIGNLLFIPHNTIAGAASAALISEAVAFCLFIYILRCHIPVFLLTCDLLMIIACNGPALLWLHWHTAVSWWFTILIVLGMTMGCYLLLHILQKVGRTVMYSVLSSTRRSHFHTNF